MEFNDLIFPAPKFRFENIYNFNDELLYIPRTTSSTNTNNNSNNNKKIEYIPCLFLPDRTGRKSKNFLLLFHGNAEDIFQARSLGEKFRDYLYMNIIIMEYPGYSIYKSSEKNSDLILENTLIVYDFIKQIFKISDNNIFIFGRSIGTSPAIYTASKRNPNSLFVVSAFTHLKSVAQHLVGFINFLLKDRFNSEDYIKNVKCPIFMVHGQSDSLIPFKETLILKENCNCPVEVSLPEKMTHNDFNLEEDIIEPIKNFVEQHCDVDEQKANFDFGSEEFNSYFKMPEDIENLVKIEKENNKDEK